MVSIFPKVLSQFFCKVFFFKGSCCLCLQSFSCFVVGFGLFSCFARFFLFSKFLLLFFREFFLFAFFSQRVFSQGGFRYFLYVFCFWQGFLHFATGVFFSMVLFFPTSVVFFSWDFVFVC